MEEITAKIKKIRSELMDIMGKAEDPATKRYLSLADMYLHLILWNYWEEEESVPEIMYEEYL